MKRQGRADLHMHTTVSDGLASVQQVLDYVAKRGHLDVIAITDHDILDASLWAYERRSQYPFEIIPGLEVTSSGGHVVALWITDPIPPDMSLAETAAAIHEKGGIAILAHPFHFHIGDVRHGYRQYLRNPEIIVQWGFDALETRNAGVLIPGCNRFAKRFGRRVPIAHTGSSDAHTLGAIGSGVTLFPGHTADDLHAAILQHQTIAQGGVWPVADCVEIIRALPHWKSPKTLRKEAAANANAEADVKLA